MRKTHLIAVLVLTCSLLILSCKEQTANTATTPGSIDSAHILTTQALGDLKMGMGVKEVEKVLGEKISLMNTNPEVWIDSAEVKYQGEPATLFFDRRYVTDTTFDLVLGGIKTSGSKFRTGTGIGMGADKNEIWNAYRQGYIFNMYPDYEDSTFTTFSKTRSFINVTTGEGDNAVLFYLENDKVKMFELRRNYDDEE